MSNLFTDADLAEDRALAEAEMVDTFTANARGKITVDGIQQLGDVLQYATPGRIGGRTASGADGVTRTVDVAGVERELLEGGLRIPVSAPAPLVGWEFVCTAVHPTSDPSLLGRRWRVVAVPAKTYATQRRLDVVEVP